MIYLKSLCLVTLVFALGACSYFDTGDSADRIEVSSVDLEQDVVFIDENSVENIIYRKTDGAVELYSLEVSEQEAVDNFVPFAKPAAEVDAGAMELNPSVEIYPIDIPMQKTLKP